MRLGRNGTYVGDFIYTVVVEQPGKLVATQFRNDWIQDAWRHGRDAARRAAEGMAQINVAFPTDTTIEIAYQELPEARRYVDEWTFLLNGHPSGTYRLHLSEELRIPTRCKDCAIKNEQIRRYASQLEDNKALRRQLIMKLSQLPVDLLVEAAELRQRSLSAEDLVTLRQNDDT